jgi:hypothetical protein
MATMYTMLFIAFAAIGLAVVLFRGQPSMVCTRCHTVARPKTRTGGSFVLEILLWLMFLLPGLIYTLIRSASTAKVCPACGSADLVPTSSPVGQQVLKVPRQ